MMSRRIVVELWVVISLWCVGTTWCVQQRTTQRISSGSVDLNHPIDGPLVMATLAVGGDPEKALETKREKESDFEREKRREMEVAREREQEKNCHQRKEQINMAEELVSSSRTNDMERKRESDRQEEITREINKAKERKKAILLETALHDKLMKNISSLRSNGKNSRSEHNSQRQIDRALRGGDVPERVKSKLVRDTLREDRGDGWTLSELEVEHWHHHQSRRKPPILIIEQVPVRYSDSANFGHSPEAHLKEPQGEGYSDSEVWYEGSPLLENDRRFEASRGGKPHVDHRAPDRPVALPRPNTAYTDRRPDRPDYPYKYDEIRISISGDPAEHQTEIFDEPHSDHTIHLPSRDDLTHDQGFPVAGVVRSPPLDLHASHVPYHHVHGLGLAAHANAANTQLALKQALVAEQALHAQAIQAGKIRQAAVAAQLVSQVAAQQFAAQQTAAQKVAAQLIAAGSASARQKAAQLGQIIAGNAAVIKTKLAHETDHRLQRLISQKPAAKVLSGAGIEVQLGDTGVTTPVATSHYRQHQHHGFLAGNQQSLEQLREELIHRLTLLKPYFERTSSGFAVPSVIPNLPVGTNLTPLQVEALPKITLQVPNVLVKPTPLHIRDLGKELPPPLSLEYVEYLMGLPDDLFLMVTNLSKSQFLVTLLPRLYRNSVHHLSPFTTSGVLGQTPMYSMPTTTPLPPYSSTDNHQLQPPSSSYGPPVFRLPSHTTLQASTAADSYRHPPFTPFTPAPLPHKISINRLFRGRPVTTVHVSKEPVTTSSISFTALHTSTTLPPPLLSSLGYGEPKPSSIIELGDLCHKCGNKDHNDHPHHHKHERRNQQEHQHIHNTSSHEDHSSGHQHIHHHHVHHHLHSVVSTSPAPSSPVTTPFYSSTYMTKEPNHHKTHGHFLTPKGQVYQNKGESVLRSEGALAVSTAASSVVTGVGLRPHGSHQQFFTPISTPGHNPHSSLPIAPLLPTTTPTAPLTSSYTSYTTSHQKNLSTTTRSAVTSYNPVNPNSHSHSPLAASSPSTTYIPLKSQETSPRLSPFTTIHPFTFITTTTGPDTLASDTLTFHHASRPSVPATSPVFVVTEIPATTDSSTVFLLSPSVSLNGQFLPVSGGVSGFKKLPPSDSGEETHSSTSDTSDTILEKIRLESEEASDLDRVPGTDFNDDDHILSPFNKRKGNVTDDTRKNPQIPSLSASFSPGNFLAQKKHPVPQLVGADGLPLTADSPPRLFYKHTYGSLALGGNRQSAKDSRPLTGENLAELPSYLKEAPPCASVPTNRSFCLMPHEYPRELASGLVERFSEELTEARKVLSQLNEPHPPDSFPDLVTTGVNTSVECETEEKTVELSWSRDVLGNWFVILQTKPFAQPTAVTTCSAVARLKGCRPLLRPRPLLALQPMDPEPRPVVLEFPLPVACVFPDSRLRAFPAFVAVAFVDPPVTPPFSDYNLDDQRSDVVIRQADNSISPPSESKLSYLSETSPFTKQRHAPLHLTSPSTHAITSLPVTSQTFSRISLSLRPDTLTEVPGEDVLSGVYLTHNRIKDKGKLKSGGTPPMLTHAVISFSITVSLLVQIQSCCQPWR